jgi:hypothetical protein
VFGPSLENRARARYHEFMMRRAVILTALAGSIAAGVGAAQDLSLMEAESMGRKLDAILARGMLAPVPARSVKAVHTSFTEREVNAYLKFFGQAQAPAGIVDPRITIGEGGQLQGRALVDLDAVRKAKPRGWTDPLGYVTGSMEVRAAGTLKTANGVGTFELQSATLGGVPLPKTLLQELVSYYTRTPELPAGFNLDQPFELPHNIRKIVEPFIDHD